MKTLLLMRHAKAEPGDPDHERGLTGGGVRDAALMGARLAAAGQRPDLALVSDARRTRETFAAIAGSFERAPQLGLEPSLYNASPDAILGRIRAASEWVTGLLVIGHNPGLAELARQVASTGPADQLRELRLRFPTSACAVITSPATHWADFGHEGTLESLLWVDPTASSA